MAIPFNQAIIEYERIRNEIHKNYERLRNEHYERLHNLRIVQGLIRLDLDREIRAPRVRKPRIRVLTKATMNTVCDDCAICMTKPQKLDSVTTDCGHEFCKGCYTDFIAAINSNKSCPMCRNPNPKITSYRTRAPNQKRLNCKL